MADTAVTDNAWQVPAAVRRFAVRGRGLARQLEAQLRHLLPRQALVGGGAHVALLGDLQVQQHLVHLRGRAGDRRDLAEVLLADAGAEPFFPPQKESTGLTLRGRWARLGELPWAQISSNNGWLALGWAMPATPPTPVGAE